MDLDRQSRTQVLPLKMDKVPVLDFSRFFVGFGGLPGWSLPARVAARAYAPRPQPQPDHPVIHPAAPDMEAGASLISLGSCDVGNIRRKLSERRGSLFSQNHDDAEVWVAGDETGKSFRETTQVGVFISQYENQGSWRKSCETGKYQRAPEQHLRRVARGSQCQ